MDAKTIQTIIDETAYVRMGGSAEGKLCDYISCFAMEQGVGIEVKQDVCSRDSVPFADQGIPASSFAGIAASNIVSDHNSVDTMAVMGVNRWFRTWSSPSAWQMHSTVLWSEKCRTI